MSDRLFMQVDDSFYDVSEIFDCLFNAKKVDFIEVVKQSSTVHVLHDQVNVLILLKKTKELHNVWMIQCIMKLNLFWKLIDHFVLLYFWFYDFLYRRNKSGIVMPEIKRIGTLQGTLSRIYLFLRLYPFRIHWWLYFFEGSYLWCLQIFFWAFFTFPWFSRSHVTI